ncbi:hypothetical protein L1987_02148 [Smallanthus sonchifolius]|uniref:Uncharacterized protein n=1 Tax=Smallanthus sonchifolius TaxID=185202 RepID=A0ACB9K732_9ASTR|nr:hypothetical protein L1987_02148 [Smallanthus sonchifolius]
MKREIDVLIPKLSPDEDSRSDGLTADMLVLPLTYYSSCSWLVCFRTTEDNYVIFINSNQYAHIIICPQWFSGITVDKAVEFSYEEVSKATHDFSPGNKIGQGGFGAVYYAELRGKVWN